MDNKTVVTRYHELYKIEQAFRIAKSDLQTRPIFHFKEEPIKLHMLICFMAMVVSKHIELQTRDSIRKFITEGKKATDVRLFNLITKQEIRIKARITPKLAQYKSVLDLPH
jgi:transposase